MTHLSNKIIQNIENNVNQKVATNSQTIGLATKRGKELYCKSQIEIEFYKNAYLSKFVFFVIIISF